MSFIRAGFIKTILTSAGMGFLMLCFLTDFSRSQFSHQAGVSFYGAGSSAGQLPFFTHTQREGRFGQGNGFFFLGSVYGKSTSSLSERFDLELGYEGVLRQDSRTNVFLHSAYIRLHTDRYFVYGGLMPETIGYVYEPLSTGSMLWSRNAKPIPKAGIQFHYRPVPFTRGFLEYKAHLAHGMLFDERYTSQPQLHEKSLYLRLGGDTPFSFHTGLVHYGMYGGNTPGFGQNPAGLTDYFRVFFMIEGDPDEAMENEDYALGDHLGAWDFGLRVNTGEFELFAYRQFIIETGKELLFNTLQDGLLGLGISRNEGGRLLDGALFEYLDTRYQLGPFRPAVVPGFSGQKSYYDHFIYQTGWTHQQRIIGNPLITGYPDGGVLNNNNKIGNNKVQAWHFGLHGTTQENGTYKLKFTRSRNYGTYRDKQFFAQEGGDYLFQNGLEQYSLYLEFTFPLAGPQNIDIMGALSFDWGEMYPHNSSLLIGMNWRIF